jgi:hypothetical protein
MGNEEADHIATVGTAEPSLHTTLVYIEQRVNLTISRLWRRRMKGLPKTDGTKLLEVFLVSRVPSAHFKSMPREVFE